jgi:hypothetical protein
LEYLGLLMKIILKWKLEEYTSIVPLERTSSGQRPVLDFCEFGHEVLPSIVGKFVAS